MGEGILLYGLNVRSRRPFNIKKSPKRKSPTKEERNREKRKYHLGKMASLKRVKVQKDVGDRKVNVGFNHAGNKHLYKDTYKPSTHLHREDLPKMDRILRGATYVKTSGLYKPRKDGIVRFHYFRTRLHGSTTYLNVAETEKTMKNGKLRTRRFLYAVRGRIKQ